jgi:hypothetical protein
LGSLELRWHRYSWSSQIRRRIDPESEMSRDLQSTPRETPRGPITWKLLVTLGSHETKPSGEFASLRSSSLAYGDSLTHYLRVLTLPRNFFRRPRRLWYDQSRYLILIVSSCYVCRLHTRDYLEPNESNIKVYHYLV